MNTRRNGSAALLFAASLAAFGCGSGDTATRGRVRAPDAPGPPTTASALLPDPLRLEDVAPDLRARLAASPVAYFRFVNQAWTHEVCRSFEDDAAAMPSARLHGDAHVEQYALTATTRGLDDFDDSARGPVLVDIVRFLGSLELTARVRGWTTELPAIVDAFFTGYRRALETPSYLPPDPALVVRLRAAPLRAADAFLPWADSLMAPLGTEDTATVASAWGRIEAYAVKSNPQFTPAYLARKKMGWLHMGIGSALTRKVLIRIEGPTPAADDDVIVEAKEVMLLRPEPCLTIPRTAEVYRVVEGLEQIGRIDHRLLVALPMFAGTPRRSGGWWVKTWDPSYRELEIADLTSPGELAELAHDVGAQLGSTNLADSPGNLAAQQRLAELEGVNRLEPRVREVAHRLTGAVVDAWQQFKSR